MKSVWKIVILIVVAGGLGLGAAGLAGRVISSRLPKTVQDSDLPAWGAPDKDGAPGGRSWGMGPGRMQGWGAESDNGREMGPGMMAPCPSTSAGERLTLERAAEIAQDAAGQDGLEVAEVMSFECNFYAIVVEPDTGRGAYEILIDPFSGRVSSEPGPNMMWNQKYGHMGGWGSGENQLTLEEARSAAKAWLEGNLAGAEVEGDGIAFYGYYTFDYEVDGQIAGMLSVNGVDGSVWRHTWHGKFIEEMEMEK